MKRTILSFLTLTLLLTLAACASAQSQQKVQVTPAPASVTQPAPAAPAPAATPVAYAPGTMFPSPEAALDAFVAALRAGDSAGLETILGAGSARLVDTGDEVVNANLRSDFLKMYDARHELAARDENTREIVVGTTDWPFTIPIVKGAAGWYFDTAAGADEIINRRVGANELRAIQTCLAIGDAEREYFRRDPDGNSVLAYTSKFRSTEGKRDGLYWEVKPGEEPSPLGELVARAAYEGYVRVEGTPYQGYYYRLLTSQGPNAPGGAYDYMVRNDQIGGYAILAWPATYGDTGVMTFMVSHAGIVFQKDLGDATADEVAKITTFDPGPGWTKVEDKDLQPVPVD